MVNFVLDGKKVLITGGTGSFGQVLTRHLLEMYPGISQIVIFSRDEFKQVRMEEQLKTSKKLRYILGDICKYEDLEMACEGIDVIFHTAALKHIGKSVDNPYAYIQTNILGSWNIIRAAQRNHVETVAAISTDKAASPQNLYGATKFCSDTLFLTSSPNSKVKFFIVRYGNFLGSRGSVLPLFLRQVQKQKLTVTSESMTRFTTTLQKACEDLLYFLKYSQGGEIFAPRTPSYRPAQLAKVLSQNAQFTITGPRNGEKIHEDLILPHESHYTYIFENFYLLLPNKGHHLLFDELPYEKAPADYHFHSGINPSFLSDEEIKNQVENNLRDN